MPVGVPHTAVQLHRPFRHAQAPVTHSLHIIVVGSQVVSQPSGAGDGHPGAAHTLAQQLGSLGVQPGVHTMPG